MTRGRLKIKRAEPAHAEVLHALITANLEEGHLLPRALEELQVHAERTVGADDLVGADAGVRRHVAVGVGKGHVGRLVAHDVKRPLQRGAHESRRERAVYRKRRQNATCEARVALASQVDRLPAVGGCHEPSGQHRHAHEEARSRWARSARAHSMGCSGFGHPVDCLARERWAHSTVPLPRRGPRPTTSLHGHRQTT